jgi:hypothetical protein
MSSWGMIIDMWMMIAFDAARQHDPKMSEL